MAQRAPTRRRRKFKGIPAITPIGSKRPVSETLPLAVERIVEQLNPEKIILFGSYAYGTPTPDSDVDLLVVMRTNKKRLADRTWPVSRLLIPRPFPVDILVRTPKEIERDLARRHFFIRKWYHAAESCMSDPHDPLAWVERAEEDYELARLSLRRRKRLWAPGIQANIQPLTRPKLL